MSVSRRHVAYLVAFAIVALCSIARHDVSIYLPVESSSAKSGRTSGQTQTEESFLSEPSAQETSVGDDAPGRELQSKRKPGKRTSHDGRHHFVEPGSQLHDLVQKWKESDITLSQAALDLNEIVSGDEYIDHKPSEGILFIKTHKTGAIRKFLSVSSPPCKNPLISSPLQAAQLSPRF